MSAFLALVVTLLSGTGATYLSDHDAPLLTSLMGYPGHLWTHGLSYAEREADILRMYAPPNGAVDLLARYHVGYVVVGPFERRLSQADDATFAGHPVVIDAGPYRLYRVVATTTGQ